MPDSATLLGIETSCDETAAAVVRADADGTVVLSSVIASQNELHEEYRGVVPEIASRAHAERLLPVVRQALTEAGVSMGDISAVAVGNRPGLIGCLLVGVSGAKALAWSLDVPLVGIDHVQAHLYAACLNTSWDAGEIQPARRVPAPRFPAIGLVVSGGHTSLFRCDSPTRMMRLGSTIDDAVGEAYDKAAAILGLGFPGGPQVDRLAQRGNPDAVRLPVSLLDSDSLDFSFSGLKTALLYAARGVPAHPSRAARSGDAHALAVPATGASAQDLAASFQHAAVRALIVKVRRAIERHPDCHTLLIGGGVSANSLLRARLDELGRQTIAPGRRIDVRIPEMQYCLDNAAMIAGLAWHILRERGGTGDDLSLSASPRGDLATV
ncbi:MAG: tRNA (adenosine(37)-N6)-threonylcarbamoyltransferase complex transferase subunit TsaD [Phycisphaerales bacterium]